MIKFVALRLFLLNCKVNPKVWVKSIQKNEDLILRLISKTLSIRFQNSIDLFVWPVNKLIKKIKLSSVYTIPTLQFKGKKMKWILACDIKKEKEIYEFEPKFVHWNRRIKTHKFITKSHARLPFHHYTAFSAGMSLFWTTFARLFRTVSSTKHHLCKVPNPSWSYLGFSLCCFPWICSNSMKLLALLFVSFVEPFFSLFLLQPY